MNKTNSFQFLKENNISLHTSDFNDDFIWGDTSDEKKITFLLSLIKNKFHDKKILEIGTYRGVTTFNISCILTTGKIYTVDCGFDKLKNLLDKEKVEHNNKIKYSFYDVGEVYKKNNINLDKIFQIIGDTTEEETINNIIKNGPYDLIYIDASHTYEGIKNDTNIAFKSLNKGGIIIWDDYNSWWSGVNKYIEEISQIYSLTYFEDNRYVAYMDKQ